MTESFFFESGFAGREGGWAGLGWAGVFLLGWAGLGWAVGLAGGWGGRGLDSLGLGLGLEVLGPDWGSGAGAGLEGAGYIEIVKGLGANNVLTESFDRKF